MAAAGKKVGMPTIGFVRGEELAQKERNPTLAFCEAEGMRLYFLSREAYRRQRSRFHGTRDRYGEPICFLAEGERTP